MSDKISKGKYGEQLAANFLVQAGYKILERNYRYKRAEVDLIAQKDGLIIFVEVKLRSDKIFGTPEEFVTVQKEENIRQVAEHYIFENDWHYDIRFDIIAIVVKPSVEIEHIKDAFI